MRIPVLVYWGYLGTLTAYAVCFVGVQAALRGTTLAGGAFQVAAGVELAAVGACLALNWRNSSRRLRARQRLDRRKRGNIFGWFCRDTVRWWRINGVILVCAGFVLVAIGIVTMRGFN
jgi:hypothetical protein